MKTLVQASTLNALMLGNFDRTVSVREFLHHADTGIGTYTGLDGEAIFEGGVAYKAAAVVLSAQTLLSAVYMGYLEGIAPIISYNYGAGERTKLQQLYRAALKTIGVLSVLTFAASFPAARPLAALYARESAHVMAMSVEGIRIFAGAFLLMGFNMFASSMFTALNDGKTSAILSLLRTLVFLIIPLLILPRFWGVDGVWLSLPAAEVLAIAVSIYYFRTKRTVYHYA